ncbi:ribosomal protein S18-alanine N-acetyltransferase [Cellulomonas sp. 179-A 9B4 NHS]|uniref:ribosomal protein S18-alanine N-acetyltransferase n=1 Tax=Cellulomonas sp. 179-A 9B4 NHS TaxID=3142379 RepID=UPI00399F200A
MTSAVPGAPAGTPAGGAVTVRPLTVDDLPDLVRLEGELFGAGAWSRESLREELRGPGRTYVGAVLPDGRLVGYAGTWFDGYDVQVMTVGTDAAHQGRGIARTMLVHLLDAARATGAEAALLEVRVDNDPAIHLYESLGFTRLGRRRGYYQPENADAWTMRRDLRAR